MEHRAARERMNLVLAGAAERAGAFARDVRAGLTSNPKSLPSSYFYDAEGSMLFEEICALPEYYLTRAEAEILRERSERLSTLMPREATLVELGSGSATKTRILIEAFLKDRSSLRYVPVDISRTMLIVSSLALLDDYPALEITAVAGEYAEGLRRLREEEDRARLILWLGSNVGNFRREAAVRFLEELREAMGPRDRLLVGIDLRKDRDVVERAYNDSLGVTARFNLNILARVNREMGGHFDLGAFRHRAVYDDDEGRIRMYLDSLRDQNVAIDDLPLVAAFREGEPLHTENSYKYSAGEIDALVTAAGLAVEDRWFDSIRLFSLSLMAIPPY